MRTLVVALGLMVASAAWAKPLPRGMKVVTKLGRPYVQQGAITVALREDDVADYEKILKTSISDDGKTVLVTATRCKGEVTDDITKVALSKIQARMENARGLLALSRKRYGEAVTRFTTAAQKDPETWSYATSLLAAQLRAKRSSAVNQTLAVHGRRNPVWFAWRIAVDPDLAPAASHKHAKQLVARTPGTTTLAKLDEHDVALSPLAGGIAAIRTLSIGSPGTTEVDFVGLSTGKRLARIPLTTLEDACDGTADSPCDDAAKARIAERATLVDRLFATLGFVTHAGALVDVRNGDPLRKGDVVIETSDDAVTVTRGGDERTFPVDGSVWAVAVTPTSVVVKLNRRNIYGCNDGSSRFGAIALPN